MLDKMGISNRDTIALYLAISLRVEFFFGVPPPQKKMYVGRDVVQDVEASFLIVFTSCVVFFFGRIIGLYVYEDPT